MTEKSAEEVETPGFPAMSDSRVRWTLLGVMLAMLLAMLDNTIVGTAMPTITRELGGLDHLSWVVTAYVLATAISTPVWGKLGDLRGRKNVFLASIVVFLIGSVASGLAQSMGQLIGFRVLQGLGAGGLSVGAFALIGDLVPPRERGRYQGMTAIVTALGTIGGPLVGGFVTGHLGWRWAFFVNLPLGLVAFVWSRTMLKLPAVRRPARIDWAGVALLAVTISATVLAASWAGVRYAWASPQILGLAALALVTLAAFVAVQRRVAEPLLPLRIFKHRNMGLVSVVTVVVGGMMFGASLYLPLYQQSVQHASAADSGLLLLPMMAAIVVVSQIPGRVMTRTGRYKIFPVLGAALLTIGSALLATMDAATGRVTTGVFMAVVGAGLGLTMQMTTTIAQNSVEMRDLGSATAAINLFRTLGGSLAVAVFGALLSRSLTAAGAATDGPAYAHAVAEGTQSVFWAACALCAVAVPAALAVREVPLRTRTAPRPARPAPAA
ncbi:MDR family MFS transporter [Actinocorallia sp. A-T 12471]|uniref:MDR family MFS transporter n=1 Tax=Actinocorallia sp. A-T 12471 TaxID=3089813 RepID=UPI0029D3E215|nr:MDR family MFS transporter [Actinocorallia sp. A-T 12471]MDX6742371.1 MDR family MFS transporter [Actinocorallia sp. A-T 12471]